MPSILPSSLTINLGLMLGLNNIQRSVGKYSGFYLNEGSLDQQISNIAPGEYIQKTKASGALVIATSAPITLDGALPDGSLISIVITSVLVLDNGLLNFTISNKSTINSATVSIIATASTYTGPYINTIDEGVYGTGDTAVINEGVYGSGSSTDNTQSTAPSIIPIVVDEGTFGS